MSNHWVRLWHDMPADAKWRTISRVSQQPVHAIIAVYVHLMVSASSNADRRGEYTAKAEDIASALDMEDASVESILTAMQGRVLEKNYLTGWKKRQPVREDGSAERAKKWRESRKRAEESLESSSVRSASGDRLHHEGQDKASVLEKLENLTIIKEKEEQKIGNMDFILLENERLSVSKNNHKGGHEGVGFEDKYRTDSAIFCTKENELHKNGFISFNELEKNKCRIVEKKPRSNESGKIMSARKVNNTTVQMNGQDNDAICLGELGVISMTQQSLDNGRDTSEKKGRSTVRQKQVENRMEKPPVLAGSSPSFNWSSGQFETIDAEKLARWQAAYPDIDVKAEMQQAACWLVENPQKKKDNYGRFLVNWFAAEQDKVLLSRRLYEAKANGGNVKASAKSGMQMPDHAVFTQLMIRQQQKVQ